MSIRRIVSHVSFLSGVGMVGFGVAFFVGADHHALTKESAEGVRLCLFSFLLSLPLFAVGGLLSE